MINEQTQTENREIVISLPSKADYIQVKGIISKDGFTFDEEIETGGVPIAKPKKRGRPVKLNNAKQHLINLDKSAIKNLDKTMEHLECGKSSAIRKILAYYVLKEGL